MLINGGFGSKVHGKSMDTTADLGAPKIKNIISAKCDILSGVPEFLATPLIVRPINCW